MKNTILELLLKHQNEYLSGEILATKLHVSRMTISKEIKKLRTSGYDIITSTKKGYCLTDSNDILLSQDLRSSVPNFYHTIEVVESIDSTNNELKRNALKLKEGFVLISDEQSEGKGRNGRSFHSPKGTGIYMSIFLQPKISLYESLKITACTSVALHSAIQNCYHINSQIKWVNDILIEDKKIAGILCEASVEMNTSNLEYMIVGIGINVKQNSFPSDLSCIAGSIESFSTLRLHRTVLIKEILKQFYHYYTELNSSSFLPIYKKYSSVLHKKIKVIEPNMEYNAFVLDINKDAHLIIKKEDGSISTLHSGEISIR